MHPRSLSLFVALACALPHLADADDGDRIVVRRPLGQDSRGQLVLRDPVLALDPTDPNSPTLSLDEGLSVEVTVASAPPASVSWTTTPTASLTQPEGPQHARIDRYTARITFDGPIEEDIDGDGVIDGYIPAVWPAQLGFVEADGTPIGTPFDVSLALTDEVPDTTYSQVFSPSEDPTRLDTLVAQVGLLGAGGNKARLVARVSDDSPAEVAYVSVSFGSSEGAPTAVPQLMYLPLKASTVRVGADPSTWSALSALSPTNQGEVPVQWSLADGFGGYVSGDDSMLVDTRDLVLQRMTSVQEEGTLGRVTTRIAAADPLDLEGGQHLLLSRDPLDDGGCPTGTVALQGRCYLDPGVIVEANGSCPIGTHLCSCGQCVQNYNPPRRLVKGGFVVIIEAPPAPSTFPATLTAEVRKDNGSLLRVGTCALESETSPCTLDYGDGQDTEDTLSAPESWLVRANFVAASTPETEGNTVALKLVPLDPNTPSIAFAQDSEFTFTSDRVKLSGNTSTIGGEWIYEVEVLDPTGSFPIATAQEGPQNGGLLISRVVFEVE